MSLEPMSLEPWNNSLLLSLIPFFKQKPNSLFIFDTISSTMDFFSCHPDISERVMPAQEHIVRRRGGIHHVSFLNGTVCLAEQQSKGRGRLHRAWHSPIGQNIYCSILWTWEKAIKDLSGLSLAIGVIIAEALKELGVGNIKLKWPNDLLINNKKVGGILIELSANKIIIGFGLNILPIEISDRPTAALCEYLDPSITRHQILAAILNNFYKNIIIFEQSGFSAFQDTWSGYNAYQDQAVTINNIVGVVEGVNELGELLLRDNNGYLLEINSGELE
jgi:BirA family biotin operon repressor/biotin-[acetyl-CoA-carboxylase] ligase